MRRRHTTRASATAPLWAGSAVVLRPALAGHAPRRPGARSVPSGLLSAGWRPDLRDVLDERRGAEAGDYSYALMHLTVFGARSVGRLAGGLAAPLGTRLRRWPGLPTGPRCGRAGRSSHRGSGPPRSRVLGRSGNHGRERSTPCGSLPLTGLQERLAARRAAVGGADGHLCRGSSGSVTAAVGLWTTRGPHDVCQFRQRRRPRSGVLTRALRCTPLGLEPRTCGLRVPFRPCRLVPARALTCGSVASLVHLVPSTSTVVRRSLAPGQAPGRLVAPEHGLGFGTSVEVGCTANRRCRRDERRRLGQHDGGAGSRGRRDAATAVRAASFNILSCGPS